MKQRAEEGDFGLGGGMLIHASLVQDRQSDKGVHGPILHLHLRKAPSTIETDQEVADKIVIESNLYPGFDRGVAPGPFGALSRLPDSELHEPR